LIVTLVLTFALGPQEIAWSTNVLTARLNKGEPSPLGRALAALDDLLCPPVYALTCKTEQNPEIPRERNLLQESDPACFAASRAETWNEGVFTLSFQDIMLKANGFSVVVNRTYDSREKRVQDFGVGWKLTLSNVDMEKDLGNNIFLTLPDGKREVFKFNPTPTSDSTIFITHYDPTPGVFDTLTVPGVDNQQLFLNFGTFFTIAGAPFDPSDVTLTRVDGTVLQINQLAGLQSITDTNGNTVTFSANGITGVGATLPFQRDSIGRITTITDPSGATISYQYSDAGDLVGVVDRVGNKTTLTYDSNHNVKDIISPSGIHAARSDYDSTGRLIATTDADGNKTVFAHDLASRTETITDRLGHTRKVQYNALGDVIAQTDALGNTTRYEFDANRNQTAMIDALGNRWEKTYNSQGLVLTDKDPLGNVTTRTYDANGHVLTVTDARGNTTVNAYDANGNLATTTDALGNVTQFGYLKGNLARRTDALGNTTTFENDARGNVTFMTDALGNQTIYHYNNLGDQTSVQQGIRLSEYAFVAFRSTVSVYDASGRITGTIDTLGNTSGIAYDQDGHQQATTDALGRRTTFHYDGRGNQDSTIFADGTSVSATFDAEARRITSTDQIGRVTSFVYDPVGRVTDTIFPDGTRTHTEFDSVGRVTTQTNARGFKTSFLYDAAGRRTSVIDALGHVTVSAYDSVGNVISVTDARGNTTRFEYDALNRRTKTIFPDGTSTLVVYDKLGRKFQEFDQANKKTEFHYDQLSRQVQVITATGAITSFVYDQLSNLVERHDPLNRVTRFEHDALGRVTKTTRPLGMSETVAYDAIGRVVSSMDFNGQTTIFAYDLASGLKTKTLPDGRTVGFTYTPTGQRSTIQDSVRGTTVFAYDSRDRLLSRTEPDGLPVSYTYDENGNRKSVTAPSGTTSYTFDALDRMETVTGSNGGVSRYTYDEVGNRKTLTEANGVVATYSYDTLNRLTNLTNAKGGTVLSAFTYALGPAGNRLSVIEQSGRVVGYGYDDDYRLTSESIFDPGATNPTVFAYLYDAAGNRKSKTTTHPHFTTEQIVYSYDDNDRLLSETLTSGINQSATNYSYDNNGSTLSVSAPGQMKVFTWTPERRLATCTISGTGAAFVAFEYDEDGIRVKKIKNGVGTRFVIDQVPAFQQVVEERDVLIGTLAVSYTYGDDLISQDRSGTRRFYSTDGQLSTRELTDDTGAVTDSYTYEAFGGVLGSTGATVNAYKYTGQQEDPEVGGYYLRARYYANASGRFLSEDYAARDGTSFHKYLYTRGSPTNGRDPSGLFTLVETLTTTAVIGIIASIGVGILEGWRDASAGGSFWAGFGRGATQTLIATAAVMLLILLVYGGVYFFAGTAAAEASLGTVGAALGYIGNFASGAAILYGYFASDPFTFAEGLFGFGLGKVIAPLVNSFLGKFFAVPPASSPPEVNGGLGPNDPVPFGESGNINETGLARPFDTDDPLVGELAREIELRYPGTVKGVNVIQRSATGETLTDFDIELTNGLVIQVKSGGGKGFTTQMRVTNQLTGGKGIAYGPQMKTSVLRGMQNEGINATRDKADIFLWIEANK